MAAFEFFWKTDTLDDALRELPKTARDAVADVIKKTTEDARKKIRFRTPIGKTSRAFNGWKTSIEKGGLRGVVYNDVPYINVLEYGSYPVRPKRTAQSPGALARGNALLGGDFPPGRTRGGVTRTRKAPAGEPTMLRPGNVSKQAPQGMVRITLIEIEDRYIFDLNEALDRAFAELD